jgi:hypothetical protein
MFERYLPSSDTPASALPPDSPEKRSTKGKGKRATGNSPEGERRAISLRQPRIPEIT